MKKALFFLSTLASALRRRSDGAMTAHPLDAAARPMIDGEQGKRIAARCYSVGSTAPLALATAMLNAGPLTPGEAQEIATAAYGRAFPSCRDFWMNVLRDPLEPIDSKTGRKRLHPILVSLIVYTILGLAAVVLILIFWR